MYSVEVRAVAPVHPTEVPDRVVDAVRAPFPEADVTVEDDRVVAHTRSLEQLRDLVREREIAATARREFRRGATDAGFSFALKKQAALGGVVNFAVDSGGELGEIDVTVTVDEPDVDAVIDHVAPRADDADDDDDDGDGT